MQVHTLWSARPRMRARWLTTTSMIVALLALAVGTPTTASAATNVAANIDQCANGPVGAIAPCLDGTLTGTSYSDWVNGNVNAQKAHWREGQFLSYRTTITGLSSGDHTLVFDYQTVHGSKHALDYAGSYDATETTSATHTGSSTTGNFNNNNPCADKLGTGTDSGCTAPGTPPPPTATTPIPSADLASEATCGGASSLGTTPTQKLGTIDIFAPTGAGATFPTNAAQYVTQNIVSGTGQCTTTMSVKFNLSGTAPSSGWTVVLTWGGHIASSLDWGVGNSASSISGSPYHMALDSLDGASTGSQDRALAAAAVAPPPTIATQVSSTSINGGGTLTDTATLTGSEGTVTGTVDFVLCSNTTTGCPQGTGTLIQSGVALVNGSATSDPFGSSLAAGNYCVGLVYHNDDNSFYSDTYSGSATNECFTVNKVTPSMSTAQQLTPNDQATLSGGVSPTGTITFNLFSPSNATCSASVGAPAFTQSVTVNGNGTYSTTNTGSTAFVASATGTWRWQVIYTPSPTDTNNNGTTSACGVESFTITQP